MEPQLKFIQALYTSKIEDSTEEPTVSGTSRLNKLNSVFSGVSPQSVSPLKARLTPRRGQLWAVKSAYEDYFGNEVVSDIPFIVLVVEANIELEREQFSRVQPISYFTEFAAGDDYTVNDASVIGFPFLVETWNEQPILNELLDYYLSPIEIDRYSSNKDQVTLTAPQAEFRKLEVENSTFLRNSVLAYLRFLEERQTVDTGVVLNIDRQIALPALFENSDDSSNLYVQAAKTGIDYTDKYFEWSGLVGSHTLTIRVKRKAEGFVLSVTSDLPFRLKDLKGNEVPPTAAETRIIFDKVPAGLYRLFAPNNDNVIKIRLK